MKYPEIFNPDLSQVGRSSQAYNILASTLMADMIKTSLGPRGMEKMYIDILGEETVTKQGGAYLRKIDVDHPAAKAVIDAVNTVDNHVGDGTISTAVMMGALLGQARSMLDLGFPTAVITRGFEVASVYAQEALEEIKIRAETSQDVMRRLAASCLNGKALYAAQDDGRIVDMLVDAVCHTTDFEGMKARTDDIKIEEKAGDPADTRLVMGTVIDKPVDSPEMPRRVEGVRILLLNDELEATRTKTESEIEITSPKQMGSFINRQKADTLEIVRRVVESGAGLVISRKGIDELAQELLARSGIMSVRRVKYNDIWWLQKATKASTCRSVQDIDCSELGYAVRVYEETVAGDRMLFVESDQPESVTILLRARTKRYLDEFHRNALNVIYMLRSFLQHPFVVYGGGSCEAIVSEKVREQALHLEGRGQVVASRFADALDEVPMTLARNLGMDPLDTLAELRSKVATSGDVWWGINSKTRRLDDLSGVVTEPLAVKRQALLTAVEAVNMILNVDDVFMKDLIDNTHCHIDGTVHAHKDPGRNHNHWEQEGLEQRQMHHHY